MARKGLMGHPTKVEIAVLALSTDGDPENWDYVIAAADPDADPWRWNYWHIPDPQPGDTYVILRARNVGMDDAADLIAHGTREQYFTDGYDAAEAVGDDWDVVDSWTVEDE